MLQGVLPDGSWVAVNKCSFGRFRMRPDEFSREVVLFTGIKHKNILTLKGCCLYEDLWLLVYEFVENFDVYHLLFGM